MESKIVSNTNAFHGSIHRCIHSNSILKPNLFGSLSLFEILERSSIEFSDFECLGSPQGESTEFPFKFISFRRFFDLVTNFASGLDHRNLLLPQDNFKSLGIMLQNSSEWIISEYSCFYLNGTSIPLYETLGESSIAFIINQCKIQTIVCGENQIPQLKTLYLSNQCPTLKNFIVVPSFANSKIDELVSTAISDTSLPNTRLPRVSPPHWMKWNDIIEEGIRHPINPTPPDPEDLATICYTSGTTGESKGVMLTHRALVSACSGGMGGFYPPPGPQDTYLSFLPLPHVFERITVTGLLASGVKVAFFRGDPNLLLSDLVAASPTIFCAVPRLLNKIESSVWKEIEKGIQTGGMAALKSRLFRMGFQAKLQALQTSQGAIRSHSIYDALLFKPLRKALGLSRVRKMVCGGAALPRHTKEFFEVLLGQEGEVQEGYGQTETAGCTTLSISRLLPRPPSLEPQARPWTGSFGSVGGPISTCEVRLASVPEMGYLVQDKIHDDGQPCMGRGEVWVRGPVLFSGYYKRPEETAQVMEGRWMRTGDIGLWTLSGQLVLIDRKKSLLKLSQGEYVSPEKIEGILASPSCPLISQIFVHGEPGKDFLIAIIVPDEKEVLAWAKSARMSLSSDLNSSLKQHPTLLPALQAEILSQILRASQAAGLKGFEIVKAVHIDSSGPWTPQPPPLPPSLPTSSSRPLLTPTLKLRRPQLKAHYQRAIQSLYSHPDPQSEDSNRLRTSKTRSKL